ncbi:hypothetical protein GQ54DRAFT_101734 [Martensiomyces pterosporus]|nr:hypothetical protein GQ54DRAFT_101734 [Martensiomyces pterosporus]
MPPFPVGILTASEKCSRGQAVDTSGPALKQLLEKPQEEGQEGSWVAVATRIVPDDKRIIADAVRDWCAIGHGGGPLCRLVIITGGTGISPSDVTVAAVEPLFTKQLPALATAMVVGSLKITPFAALSQVAAGVVGETIVLAVPGSRKGSVENVQQILAVLPHAVSTAMAATGTRHLHSDKGVPLAASSQHAGEGQRRVACGCSRADEETENPHNRHHHTHSHSPAAAQGLSNDLGAGVSRRARKSPYPMIPVDTALDLVLSSLAAPAPVDLPLREIREGQILAEDVIAQENVPAYRASIMDGYAVKSSDGPGTYTVRGSAVAGMRGASSVTEESPLQAGEIVRIATGAPVPPGADAVVMVEDTELLESNEEGEEVRVRILDSGRVEAGQSIRPVGHDMRLGSVVLRKGAVVTSVGGEIGTLAISGNKTFRMYTLPKIAIMSTGDEVIDVLNEPLATASSNADGSLKPGTIRDSNRPALLAALRALGCEAVDLGVARDDPDTLAKTISEALATCEGIITTGGVSMGERDWLKPVVEQRLGGKILFGRVAMKPSKPTTFATIPRDSGAQKFIFALPGNPVSALVAFHMFAAPAMRKLAGHLLSSEADGAEQAAVDTLRPSVEARFEGSEVRLDQVRPEFVRGVLVWKRSEGRWTVGITDRHQQSSRMASMQGANALIALPRGSPEKRSVKEGEAVTAVIIASPHFR